MGMIYLFKLGRLPNDPSKPRLRLSSFLKKEISEFPENRDWLSEVDNFPMYLNDRIGDCTCAAAGHIIQVATTYGQGNTVTISDTAVLDAYKAVSGYNPETGANDNGAVMQQVCDYWRKTGVGGHKITAFAEVDVHNGDELRSAMNLFGFLYIGINFPNTAMDQYSQGQPWDVVDGSRLEGGHAINAGFYDVSDKMWKVVTWGKVQPMTQAFWDKYVEEAWVIITPEWINKNGTNPAGIDVSQLGQDFTNITGEPSPFPAPTPTPAPTPEPVNPDESLAAAAKKFFNSNPKHHKALQHALHEWLDAKGL